MSALINKRKKPRIKGGVIFSHLSKERIEIVKTIRKMCGDDPFFDPNHRLWREVMSAGMRQRQKDYGYSDPYLEIADCAITYKIGQMGYRSIYIESPAVMDFLEKSEPRQSDGVLIKQAAIDIQKQSEGGGVAVHLPNRKESIFITSADNAGGKINNLTQNEVMVNYLRGEDIGYTPIRKDGTWVIEDDGIDPEASQLNWRIVFNLFLYMDAFPECVSDGPPDLTCGEIDGIAPIRVCGSKSIEDLFHQVKKTPHMRRGHFRVLRSERFRNKRFQAVYVKPSMVGGSASTVSEP